VASASSAIDGTAFGIARSFAPSFNVAGGAVTDVAIDPGAYVLNAQGAACLVRLRPATGGTDVAALPGTQPAPNAPNGTVYIKTDDRLAFDVPKEVPAGGWQISILGFAAVAGKLVIVGPIMHGTVK